MAPSILRPNHSHPNHRVVDLFIQIILAYIRFQTWSRKMI